jgi:hypothetical protein
VGDAGGDETTEGRRRSRGLGRLVRGGRLHAGDAGGDHHRAAQAESAEE